MSTRPDGDHVRNSWYTGKVPPLDSVSILTFIVRSRGLNLCQRCITHMSSHSSLLLSNSVTSRQVLWRRSSRGIICVYCLPTHHRQRRMAPAAQAAITRTSNLNTATILTPHLRLRTDARRLVPYRTTMGRRTIHKLIHITYKPLYSATRSCWRQTTG